MATRAACAVRLAQVGAQVLLAVEVGDLEVDLRHLPVGLPGRSDPPGRLAELDRHREELLILGSDQKTPIAAYIARPSWSGIPSSSGSR